MEPAAATDAARTGADPARRAGGPQGGRDLGEGGDGGTGDRERPARIRVARRAVRRTGATQTRRLPPLGTARRTHAWNRYGGKRRRGVSRRTGSLVGDP